MVITITTTRNEIIKIDTEGEVRNIEVKESVDNPTSETNETDNPIQVDSKLLKEWFEGEETPGKH